MTDIRLAAAVRAVELPLPAQHDAVGYNRIIDQTAPQRAVDKVRSLAVTTAVGLRGGPERRVDQVLLPLRLDIAAAEPRALLAEIGKLVTDKQALLQIRLRQPQGHVPDSERRRAPPQEIQVVVRGRHSLLMASPPQPRERHPPRCRKQAIGVAARSPPMRRPAPQDARKADREHRDSQVVIVDPESGLKRGDLSDIAQLGLSIRFSQDEPAPGIRRPRHPVPGRSEQRKSRASADTDPIPKDRAALRHSRCPTG